MDRWKDSEVEKMKVGGNTRAKDFFESQSDIYPGISFSEKYNSRAAALYRDKVCVCVQGEGPGGWGVGMGWWCVQGEGQGG